MKYNTIQYITILSENEKKRYNVIRATNEEYLCDILILHSKLINGTKKKRNQHLFKCRVYFYGGGGGSDMTS